MIGGLAGYVIGVKNSAKQNQKARNDAKQTQEFEIENVINNDDKVHNTLRQNQKANNNSSQVQIGGIRNHDER